VTQRRLGSVRHVVNMPLDPVASGSFVITVVLD
jgi:hypothetical protein